MYAKNKGLTAPSDIHAKDKLNLYIYEYLYHIGASKAAQGFCADMKWEPNKMSLGEAPGFLLSWWCVFWDLYSAAPERRDQHPHSEEAKAFHDYGFINSSYAANGMPPQGNPNPNPPQPPMQMGDNMHNPNVPFFNPTGQPMMNSYPRYPNNPGRGLVRMPPQPDYPVGPNGGPMMAPQMDPSRGLRMTSPGARMPNPPMGHTGPSGPPPQPPPNTYRPPPMSSAMSPSLNQPGNRIYIPNSPGVGGYSSSSPISYGTPCPTGHASTTPMIASPQDPNGGEMTSYVMRTMSGGLPPPPGSNQMYHESHLNHMQPMPSDMAHHSSINGDYESQLKQSPSQPPAQGPPQVQPPDGSSFSYNEDPTSDTNAILKLKESMQEEVKRFDKTPNNSSNDDFNQYNALT